MNGTLALGDVLYARTGEVHASTYFNTATPGDVINSPADPTEQWTYVPGAWRDPVNGSFLSAGSFGYVFGLSADRSLYYIISRAAADAGGEMGSQSITTARNVLKSFLRGYFHPRGGSRWQRNMALGYGVGG